MTSWLLLGACLLLSVACVPRRWDIRAFPRCSDELPIKILVDPACPPDGVCGYSCLPGRWAEGG